MAPAVLRRVALLVAVLAIAVHAANLEANRQQALEVAWSQELDEPETKVKAYVSPVKRVVSLLQKMKAELEAESDKEAEMYDKMVCWCQTNDKEKTKAIADAEAKDVQLGAEIESRSARFGQLTTEIAKTKEEIATNTDALRQATAIREDEASKFRDEEKDMVQAVTNLRNAIAVLSKHQGSSLLQMDGSLLSGIRVLLRNAALTYETFVAGRAERHLGKPPASLLQASSGLRSAGGGAQKESSVEASIRSAMNVHDVSFADVLPLRFAARVVADAAASTGSKTFLQVANQQPLYESRSSARSAGIYGVMTQMLEEFEAQLSSAQKEELSAQEAFTALEAAKTSEIDAGKKKLDEMQLEDADNQKALSDAKEDLAITRKQRSEDVEFLRNLKLTCNDLDDQWEKRSKTRAAETKAVAEAIAVLTEDDNREMLAKSVTLLQERSEAISSAEAAARRAGAVGALRKAAGSPDFDADDLLAAWHGRHSTPMLGAAAGPRAQLSTLAMAAQLDTFTKVKEMMDKMIVELKEQQTAEVKFKDYCETELKDNERTMYDKNELKKDLEAKIDELTNLIQKLTDEIAAAKSQIAANQVEIKKASHTREEENKEFQSVVSDQRATQTILSKALMKLKDFYAKEIGKVALLQKGKQEPPVKFNAYKANAGASPVMGLIEQIVEDSEALEAEATSGEKQAQADYERFVTDSNALIGDLRAAATAKTKAIGAAKSDMAEAQASLESTVDELESLAAYKADLHGQCDFVLKNFDIRQKARLEEIEAIQAAKGILSGDRISK